jgi:hypothetical protein
MGRSINGSQFTRIYDRFQYHLEDCDCSVCKYWCGKKKGCSRKTCCCEDIKADCIANGRITRTKEKKRKWSDME